MEESAGARRLFSAANALVMAAARARSLAFAVQGIDELEKRMGRSSLESTGVVLEFLRRHPDMAAGFLSRAGVASAVFESALAEPRTPEPPPDPPTLSPHATEEQRRSYESRKSTFDERQAKGESAPFSKPTMEGLRVAKRAPSGCAVGALLATLLEEDSNARAALLSVADPAQLEAALLWLRTQPDPEGSPDLFGDIKANMRETMDAVWPSIQAKVEAAGGARRSEAREALYAKDPSRYEAPLDVAAELAKAPVDPEWDYSRRAGVLLHAAANEARIRHAPEATLDHLLVALLRDGTDTAAFLDGRGVDRADWSRRLDAALPCFAEGPRWPPNARDLNMGLHLNRSYRVKPLPEGKEIETLTKEERKQYVERVVDHDLRFTDLRFLANLPDEPKAVGHALFAEAGITEDELKAEIVGREKGDRDWWRKRPDLVAQLRDFEPNLPALEDIQRASICVDAAQYEARMRGAPVAEPDDLFVALLVQGTDLWTLLGDLGIDQDAMRERIDAGRPRFENGPMFPETLEHLNPAGIKSKEGLSDLLFLREGFWLRRSLSPGLRLLREAGLTEEAVDKRLDLLGVVPLGKPKSGESG